MTRRLAQLVALGALCCLVTPLNAQQARIFPPKRGGLTPPVIIPTFPDQPRGDLLQSITFEQDGKPIVSEETKAVEAEIRRMLPGDLTDYTIKQIAAATHAAAASTKRERRPWWTKIRVKLANIFEVEVEIKVGP